MIFSKQDLQRVDVKHVRSLPFLERFKPLAPGILKLAKFVLPFLRLLPKQRAFILLIIEACEGLIESEKL